MLIVLPEEANMLNSLPTTVNEGNAANISSQRNVFIACAKEGRPDGPRIIHMLS
jgi:hypothetical protein